MAGFTDALEIALLDHLFTDPAYTPPANWFVALSTTTPTEAAANFTEPTGGAYARVSTAATDWAAASGTAPVTKANGVAITFPAATASWGTVTHFGLYTAVTAGTLSVWGLLTTAQAIGVGNTPSFAIGALVIKLGDPGDVY